MKPWIAVLVLAAAEATAQAPSRYHEIMGPYEAELSRQCPAKRLELLAPADLRDALDSYKERQQVGPRILMDHREQQYCSRELAGTSCPNVADIEVASELRQTQNLAAKVCSTFKGCREQSDCELAS